MAAHSGTLPHPYFRPPRSGAVPLIAPRELKALLGSDRPPILLDVRPPRERRLARLPNDRALPLEEMERALPTLPHDRPIVAYDHLGFRARLAVGFLQERGWPLAAALEGGIDEYARTADPSVPRYPPDDPAARLLLVQLPRPDTGCLAYLVADADAEEAVVIDPGRDVAPYRALLGEHGFRLRAIVETHTHADHLAGHAALHGATDAPIYVSRRSPAAYPHEILEEGSTIEFGGEAIHVIETPGHTRDHLTLRLGDRVFTGDTMLLGACGRTDLGDGSPDLLWSSLTEKLLRLPDATEVYPAHFGARHALPDRYVSTIGFERSTNEALRQGSLDAFRRYMTEGWPAKPEDFDRIVTANLEA
jgi:glyoxylase-like metal-dependent hydrolase (beta-lactamase superfamily II)